MNQSILKENKLTETNVALLNLFFEKGDQTVAELAAGLNVSIPYATKSLNELISAKMVHETGKRDNHSRRAPRVYDLIPEAGYFLGIDTGHDRLNLALTDFCGNIVSSNYKIPYDYVNDLECFETLIALIDQFIEQSGIERSNIIKACMTVGGRVNPYEGKAHNYFTCLDKTLAEALTDALHIDTCIDNDTRCMTFGEWYKGSCKGQRNVVFVNVSWGLGIGIIIDGKMCLGKSGYSGEMGHVHIYNNGIICHCGKTGCLETYCSATGVARTAREWLEATDEPSLLRDVEEISSKSVYDAAKAGDALAKRIFEYTGKLLGRSFADFIAFSAPEAIVLFGGLARAKEYLYEPMLNAMNDNVLPIWKGKVKLIFSQLKESDAAILGASALAWEL